ncbi:MAG: DUF2029 domain-containing protein [Thermoplasmata archaeon]|nr:MAG: DUF2029 domain-containing protein [Thermoplasmata archaeon]
MLQGDIPYRDFYGGNKPPLYELLVFLIGYLFGPGPLPFRAVFSVFDALIPVVLFCICVNVYNERFALISSLSYSLFPISIICIGLSGHYESVVVLFSLMSILFLPKKRFKLSGLSLGISFALKLYPIVLLPFFLTVIKSWKMRISYTILFLLPMLVSLGTLYLISPSAFFKYLVEESEWGGKTAISSVIEMMVNTSEIFSIKISWLVLAFFGFLILLLFIDWSSPKREMNLIKWFKIIIFIFIFYYGFYIIFGVIYYKNPLYMALIPLVIYFTLAVLLLHKCLPKIIPKSLTKPNSEALFIVSTFAIMLFIFGLPNYSPWYFIWYLPFLLMIRTNKIKYLLLWILPWHGIGEHMRLLPGMKPVD